MAEKNYSRKADQILNRIYLEDNGLIEQALQEAYKEGYQQGLLEGRSSKKVVDGR